MAVEVEPVGMGDALTPVGIHRIGVSDRRRAAATTTLLAERVARPGTAVASLLAPSRQSVTPRHSALDEADR